MGTPLLFCCFSLSSFLPHPYVHFPLHCILSNKQICFYPKPFFERFRLLVGIILVVKIFIVSIVGAVVFVILLGFKIKGIAYFFPGYVISIIDTLEPEKLGVVCLS